MTQIEEQPWWGIALGLLPTIALLDGGVSPHPVAAGLVLLVLAAYAVASWRARAVLPWSLPGIGACTFYLMDMLWRPTGPLYATRLLMWGSVACFGLLLIWGAWLARRRWGAAAVLLPLPWFFAVYLGILDPTYGYFLWRPDAWQMANVIELGVYAPALVLLPAVVLRGRRVMPSLRLYGLLSLELALLASVPRFVWMQQVGTVNAPSLRAAVLRLLTLEQLAVAAMMGVVFAVALLYGRLWRARQGPAESQSRYSTPSARRAASPRTPAAQTPPDVPASSAF